MNKMNRAFRTIAILVILVSFGLDKGNAQRVQRAYAFKVCSGLYDVRRENPPNLRQIEFALGSSTPYFRPFVGLLSSAVEDVYVFIGNSLQERILGKIFVDVNFAAGYYSKGRGTPLGHPLEFRSGIGLGWEWENGSQVAATFFHISNGGISKSNPGLESLVVSYSFLVPGFD
jgi:hypothetical protein